MKGVYGHGRQTQMMVRRMWSVRQTLALFKCYKNQESGAETFQVNTVQIIPKYFMECRVEVLSSM